MHPVTFAVQKTGNPSGHLHVGPSGNLAMLGFRLMSGVMVCSRVCSRVAWQAAEDTQCGAGGARERLQLAAAATSTYRQCVTELARQVTVGCSERGALMARLALLERQIEVRV